MRWYIAIALSITLHAMLLVRFGGVLASNAAEDHLSDSTMISYLTFEPVATPLEKMEKATQQKQPKHDEVLNDAAAAEKKKETPEQATQQPKPEPKPAAIASKAAPDAQMQDGLIKKETDLYLSQLMAHIEKHKWYPKAARRRGIEGDVSVHFTVLPDGSVEALRVGDSAEVLTKAVRQAVEDASPMPKPPASLHCPLPCQFKMRFSLDV